MAQHVGGMENKSVPSGGVAAGATPLNFSTHERYTGHVIILIFG